MALEERLRTEAGRKFHLQAKPMPPRDGVIDCEALVIDPLKRLSYS